ncbi:MAG: iron-containing alcohol dehydrogenase, partial [Clostridia bacterium]|nr:iron-containing alcohol dehydrogenase [Clostridia bacterium]
MPIHEESFRIGCGRYIQGKGYASRCGDEVRRFGTAPLIIGDDTTLSVAGERIVTSVSKVCNKYEVYAHNGTCNDECAAEVAEMMHQKGLDVVVGTGGGVIMDFAKLCAHFAKVPVINVPTSSATCAAFASLSVRYTPDGRTVGSKHYEKEVDAVIVDTEIIATQPTRLFLSGMFDSIAKYCEIKQRISEISASGDAMGLDYAYAMSARSYEVLNNTVSKCINDMENGIISTEFENAVFAIIAATGVISGIARGSNQCALAHKFYEVTRLLFPETSKPYLHGELVGMGLLLQNHFNGEEETNQQLLRLMKQHNMPYRISDVGIDSSAETFEEYYNKICASSAIDDTNEPVCQKFRKSLEYMWKIC